MGRKSPLTEKQWDEIERRSLNEPIRALAREFGITESPIRARLKARFNPLNNIAKQLAVAEMAFEALPVKAQVKTRSLADGLKHLSTNMIDGSISGSEAFVICNRVAAKEAKLLEGKMDFAKQCTDPAEKALHERDAQKHLATTMMLSQAANEAAKGGFNLLAANKNSAPPDDENKAPVGLGSFYGEE